MDTIRVTQIRQMTIARYATDIPWEYVSEWIERQSKDNNIDNDPDSGLILSPEYQRDYVWTENQKIKYVEWGLKGGRSGRDIYWNHPGWMKGFKGRMEIVDGKQRIDAVLGFLHNEFPVFDKFYYKDFEILSPGGRSQARLGPDPSFRFHINDLESREEVLQWYIDMNTGGTYHTEEEINKVKRLLAEEQKKRMEMKK